MSTRLNGYKADTANKFQKRVAEPFSMPRHCLDIVKPYILQNKHNTSRDRKYTGSFLISNFKTLKHSGTNITSGYLAILWRNLSFCSPIRAFFTICLPFFLILWFVIFLIPFFFHLSLSLFVVVGLARSSPPGVSRIQFSSSLSLSRWHGEAHDMLYPVFQHNHN